MLRRIGEEWPPFGCLRLLFQLGHESLHELCTLAVPETGFKRDRLERNQLEREPVQREIGNSVWMHRRACGFSDTKPVPRSTGRLQPRSPEEGYRRRCERESVVSGGVRCSLSTTGRPQGESMLVRWWCPAEVYAEFE
jgi:hypothetical protein